MGLVILRFDVCCVKFGFCKLGFYMNLLVLGFLAGVGFWAL